MVLNGLTLRFPALAKLQGEYEKRLKFLADSLSPLSMGKVGNRSNQTRNKTSNLNTKEFFCPQRVWYLLNKATFHPFIVLKNNFRSKLKDSWPPMSDAYRKQEHHMRSLLLSLHIKRVVVMSLIRNPYFIKIFHVLHAIAFKVSLS